MIVLNAQTWSATAHVQRVCLSTLKNIAVLFDASVQGLHVLETAARMAGRQASHLIGITAMDRAPRPVHDRHAINGAVAEVLAHSQATIASRLLALGQRLSSAVQRHANSGELRIISFAESSSESSLHALGCDLLILSSPALSGSPRSWATQSILFESGLSLLVVPWTWADKPVATRILVVWNGSRQSGRAITNALPLLAAADVVKIVVVDPEKASERHGHPPGVDMVAFLAEHRVAVDVAAISSGGRSVAETIQAYAASIDADMLVIGAHTHIAEGPAEEVTKTLLSAVALPMFVSP
ncbi:hypothetical protein XarjCFBP7653_09995 [Xanthomonas arboricola]|nr:hypothetical protein XarjCFBP7653_09995 [Xanthomonas arboricola]